jgi:hypothetical protein
MNHLFVAPFTIVHPAGDALSKLPSAPEVPVAFAGLIIVVWAAPDNEIRASNSARQLLLMRAVFFISWQIESQTYED